MELRRSLQCAVMEMLLRLLPSFTSWLARMPKSILPTKFRQGLLRPTVTSKLKRVSCALGGEQILPYWVRGACNVGQGFWAKPFYPGRRRAPNLQALNELSLLGITIGQPKPTPRPSCLGPCFTEVFVQRLRPYRLCPWRIPDYRSSRRYERETATYRPLMRLQTTWRRCW